MLHHVIAVGPIILGIFSFLMGRYTRKHAQKPSLTELHLHS